MSGAAGLVALVAVMAALGGVLALGVFVGCEGGGPGFGRFAVAFHYDPTMRIGGREVLIRRVDFLLFARGELKRRMGLVSDGTLLFDGEPKDEGWPLVQVEPAHGLYRILFWLPSDRGGGTIGVRSEAFASASDSEPTFPSSPMIPDESFVGVGETKYFDFTLVQEAGAWVVAPERT